jgi:sporulation protein YlmC with PRC-barrel domain
MKSKQRIDTIAWAVASVFSVAAMVPAAYGANTDRDTRKDTRAMQEQSQPAAAVRNMRVSNLIGKDVRNTQGEDLGDIKDVIVDLNGSRVHYVVLSFGGFMGLGDKQFAFPARAFNIAADKDELVLNIDKERLKRAPGFEQAKRPDWNNPEYRGQVDRYFGEMYRTEPAANMRLVSAKELTDKELKDARGRDAGEIEDLVVSLADGKVRYAVVSLDKNWGPEDKHYAIPLRALKPGAREKDDFVLNIDRDRVAQLPSFEKGRWPDASDARWNNQLDRFTLAYGAGAYGTGTESAQRADAARRETTTEPGKQTATRAERAMQEQRAKASDQQAATNQRNMRLNQLIGKDVRNAQGEDLGDIKDVVVDLNNGRVHYVVLSFGGFLGLGDKQFAYPLKVFKPAADRDELVLNVDKERLKKAPGFEQAREPDWNRPEYRGQVDKYFGDMVQVEPRPNMRLIRGSNLIGKDVNGSDGKQLGEIEDVVVSLIDGDVRYAVLAFDKSWSLGEKRFVFPLKAFKPGQRLQDDFVLDVNRERLARVPSFERNQWPDINSARWNADVDRYLITATVAPLPATAKDSRVGKREDDSRAMAEAKPQPASKDDAFRRLDQNNDGRISQAEFEAGSRR